MKKSSLNSTLFTSKIRISREIYKEVNNVLAVNPYGNFKDEVNIGNLKTNIKSLKGSLKHSFRIQIGD